MLFYTNMILTIYLAQHQNTFFWNENQRDASFLQGNAQNMTTEKL